MEIAKPVIYFLSDYIWAKGILVSEGKKNFRIDIPSSGFYRAQTKYVAKEKCAHPTESICVIWELWRGKNGRGGYRVEKELYPEDRISADRVNYQHVGGLGRIDEIEYGIKR